MSMSNKDTYNVHVHVHVNNFTCTCMCLHCLLSYCVYLTQSCGYATHISAGVSELVEGPLKNLNPDKLMRYMYMYMHVHCVLLYYTWSYSVCAHYCSIHDYAHVQSMHM